MEVKSSGQAGLIQFIKRADSLFGESLFETRSGDGTKTCDSPSAQMKKRSYDAATLEFQHRTTERHGPVQSSEDVKEGRKPFEWAVDCIQCSNRCKRFGEALYQIPKPPKPTLPCVENTFPVKRICPPLMMRQHENLPDQKLRQRYRHVLDDSNECNEPGPAEGDLKALREIRELRWISYHRHSNLLDSATRERRKIAIFLAVRASKAKLSRMTLANQRSKEKVKRYLGEKDAHPSEWRLAALIFNGRLEHHAAYEERHGVKGDDQGRWKPRRLTGSEDRWSEFKVTLRSWYVESEDTKIPDPPYRRAVEMLRTLRTSASKSAVSL